MNTPFDDFEPFYFGEPEKQLFGNYHKPASTSQFRDGVVVLCNALADEYIQSHRTVRQLATRLARIGLPTLRFDYYGCGDSSGEDIDATLEHWLNDIQTAIEEAKRRSGSRQVYLVGLRFGSALAALAAARYGNVAKLVLWETVTNGLAYWEDITEWNDHRVRMFLSLPEQVVNDETAVERVGFVFSRQMLNDLRGMDLMTMPRKPADQVLIVEREEQASIQELGTWLVTLGSVVTFEYRESPVIWREDADKALVPFQSVQAIVEWLQVESQGERKI